MKKRHMNNKVTYYSTYLDKNGIKHYTVSVYDYCTCTIVKSVLRDLNN